MNSSPQLKQTLLLYFVFIYLGIQLAFADCRENIPVSTPSYNFNITATDGTVIHQTTTLMWSRCLLGQIWDHENALCSGAASELTWQEALQLANTSQLAGYTDWRLPNIKELASIHETSCDRPAINETIFPNTTSRTATWSSTSRFSANASAARILDPSGQINSNSKNNKISARLVRGGQQLEPFRILTPTPVSRSSNGIGEALYFPYYTVRNGFSTFLDITNTSHRELAVRVNIREGRNGRLCSDFTIILPQHDVWVAAIEAGNGIPRIRFTDESCVFPVDGTTGPQQHRIKNFRSDWFVGANQDSGEADIDRCREGFVEVIQMGSRAVASPPLTDGVNHPVNSVNCSAVERAFNDDLETLRTAYEEPINALQGAYTLIRGSDGKAVGGDPFAIANLLTGSSSEERALFNNDLLEAPSSPLTLNRNDISSVSRLNLNTEASFDKSYTDHWLNGINAVSAAMTATSISNKWTNNTKFGAETAWIATLPTRQYFVDTGGPLSGLATGTDALFPFTESVEQNGNGQSCYPVKFKLFNRTSSVHIQDGQLCNQVNIITFNEVNLLGSKLTTNVNSATLDSNSGWMEIGLNNDQSNHFQYSLGSNPEVKNFSGRAYLGIPIIGAALTTRSVGASTGNYGTLWHHKFKHSTH